jgi:hypothetical protein
MVTFELTLGGQHNPSEEPVTSRGRGPRVAHEGAHLLLQVIFRVFYKPSTWNTQKTPSLLLQRV